MPDTFQSWFLVAHLHIWLLLVRLKREGPDGTFMIKQVVTTFWEDVEARMKELGVTSSVLISKNLREFLQQFYGFTLSYEEVGGNVDWMMSGLQSYICSSLPLPKLKGGLQHWLD